MWNPHLGEKLFFGTSPPLSWFHRPLPMLSYSCSISLQQLQLLLTCQILKILWLSLNWRSRHCLVRQVPRGHCLRPCSEALLPTSNPKVHIFVVTSGPLTGEDRTKSLPRWALLLFSHSHLPNIKWKWLHSLPMPRGWVMLLRFTTSTFSTCSQTLHASVSLASTNIAYMGLQNSQGKGTKESPWGWGQWHLLFSGPASIGWGQDIDTNPFAFPRYAQMKLASPLQVRCRVSLYLSICRCYLDLSGSHQGVGIYAFKAGPTAFHKSGWTHYAAECKVQPFWAQPDCEAESRSSGMQMHYKIFSLKESILR